jgi:hypothetical protein
MRTVPGKAAEMTQYVILFNDEWVQEHTAEELHAKGAASQAVLAEMQVDDVLIFTHGGIGRETAVCSVVNQDGTPVFSDGPYTETKEHLGGFCVIEVRDDDAARYWAGRLATALDWPQEVHRFNGRGFPRADSEGT